MNQGRMAIGESQEKKDTLRFSIYSFLSYFFGGWGYFLVQVQQQQSAASSSCISPAIPPRFGEGVSRIRCCLQRDGLLESQTKQDRSRLPFSSRVSRVRIAVQYSDVFFFIIVTGILSLLGRLRHQHQEQLEPGAVWSCL